MRSIGAVVRDMLKMSTLRYATDLSDAEGTVIQPLLPPTPLTGRPRVHPCARCSTRSSINSAQVARGAIYLRNGPPGKRSTTIFASGGWMARGSASTLRCVSDCASNWRDPQPSAGSIDSQSVKTTALAANAALTQASRPKPQAPCVSGYRRTAAQSHCPRCRHHGSRWVKLLLTNGIQQIFPRLRHIWLDGRGSLPAALEGKQPSRRSRCGWGWHAPRCICGCIASRRVDWPGWRMRRARGAHQPTRASRSGRSWRRR